MTAHCFSTTLCVGDLHPRVTEDALREEFSSVGRVKDIRICRGRDAAKKRNFSYAYVNLLHENDAIHTRNIMNLKTISRRPMRILRILRIPPLRSSGICNVFIKNLHESCDAQDLYKHFSEYGWIVACMVVTDESRHKGYGFVHFESGEAACHAVKELHGQQFMSQKIYVGNFISRREPVQFSAPQANGFANIFVKNFCDQIDDGKLRQLFERFGEITSARVMTDDTDTSTGFGFVSFKEAKSAENAVFAMNGTELNGLQIYVAFSEKKSVREARLKKKFDDLLLELRKRHDLNLYVKNLQESVDDATLYETFKEFGTITSAKVMMESGRSKGFGFVCFSTPEAAKMALEMRHCNILKDKPMYISWAQRKEERRKQLTEMYKAENSIFQLNNANDYVSPSPQFRIYYQQECMNRPETDIQTASPAMDSQGTPYPQTDVTPQKTTRGQTTAHNLNALTRQTNVHKRATPKTTIGRPSTDRRKNRRMSGQKEMIKDSLELIIRQNYSGINPKISGMLLDLDTSELLNMLKCPELLRKGVQEALGVLKNHQDKEDARHRDLNNSNEELR